jgi:hypothetical protein
MAAGLGIGLTNLGRAGPRTPEANAHARSGPTARALKEAT